jgi:hypothetical protein
MGAMIHLWATIRGKSFPVTNPLMEVRQSLCSCMNVAAENTRERKVSTNVHKEHSEPEQSKT